MEPFLPNCWGDLWILLQGMSLSQYLAGSSISSNMVFVQLSNAKQALLQENKENKSLLDQLGSNCIYRRWGRITNQKTQKECLVLFNCFCKDYFASEGCKNAMLLEMPLPATKSDKGISCKRGKFSTLWSRCQR